MQFIRTQYRQRPTKWIYLQRYYNIQRTLGRELRSEQKRLLLEGRMSLPAYQHNYNLEACTEWKWIQNQLKRAATKREPLKALNQINIYRLEQCVDAIEDLLKRSWEIPISIICHRINFPHFLIQRACRRTAFWLLP